MISMKLKYQLIQSETMDGSRGPFSYEGTGMGIFYPPRGTFIGPMVSPSGEPSLGPLSIGSLFCMYDKSGGRNEYLVQHISLNTLPFHIQISRTRYEFSTASIPPLQQPIPEKQLTRLRWYSPPLVLPVASRHHPLPPLTSDASTTRCSGMVDVVEDWGFSTITWWGTI